MTPRVIVVIVAIVALGLWMALRAGGKHEDAAHIGAVGLPPSLSERTTKIDAREPSMRASMSPRAAVRETVFDDFLASRDYRAIYDRLHGTAEGDTPKGRLVLYEVLRECATVTGGVPWPLGPRRQLPGTREQFIAGLAPNDPQRERRIAAYDELKIDRCKGLSEVTLSQDELAKLLDDAAAGGEPAARALVVERDLWTARRGAGQKASPTDAQIQAIQQAAASRDPEAVRVAGRVLGNNWNDYTLRVGADELPVETRPFVYAFAVLACEYGAPCGRDTLRMQQFCALQGQCDAQTFPEWLANYGSSPHDASMLMQYRSLVRTAIETGDWSQFRVVRGQPATFDRQMVVPGLR